MMCYIRHGGLKTEWVYHATAGVTRSEGYQNRSVLYCVPRQVVYNYEHSHETVLTLELVFLVVGSG